MITLPEPRILSCYHDEVFQPRLSAMCLDWNETLADTQRLVWELPEGVAVHGPAPERFGILVQRYDTDRYAVRVTWNQTHFAWRALTRRQLLDCCLGSLLSALGTDLHHLLDQPVLYAETLSI